MSPRIEAKVTHAYAASPERVYDALLDPVKVRLWQKAWLASGSPNAELLECTIDPQVNGKFLYVDRRGTEEARAWGSFLALEKPRKIVHTWITDPVEQDDPSIVTMIIEPAPDGRGSVATLYNEMDAEWAEYLPQTERAWQLMLEAVDGVLRAEGPS